MSISGIAAGTPHSISYSVVCRCAPPAITPTSALVPPMSSVSRSGSPACRPNCAAASIPPAGPDIAVWIGFSAAAAASITPPFDFMIVHGAVSPAAPSVSVRLPTYRRISGFRYASAIVVDARSYSRQIGAT